MTAVASPHRVPAVGELAPDFSLPSTAGGTVSLADFRGRKNVLVAFFPLAFSSTCTAELCAFSEDFDQFETGNTVVLPISVDHTYSLKEFKAKYALRADLLSDFRREASRAYGVLIEDRFHSGRAYFLIDKSGIVRWAQVEETPRTRRENAEILAHIAALG